MRERLVGGGPRDMGGPGLLAPGAKSSLSSRGGPREANDGGPRDDTVSGPREPGSR